MRMAFYFDQTRCMGCNSCTVACKDWYNVNPGPVRYRKQFTYESEDGVGFLSLVMSCNHCEEPACKKACSSGAITKRPDGIVVVDRTKCQDLRSCITACPFGEPGIADDRQEPTTEDTWRVAHPMQKCNMCVDLQDKGEKPVCVRACPAHAIEVGDYDELLRTHAGAVPLTYDKFPYAWINNTDKTTGPSLIIKPRKTLEVYGPNK